MASDHYSYYLLAVVFLWAIGLGIQFFIRLISPKRKRATLRVDLNLLTKGEKWQSTRINSGYFVGGLLATSLVLILLFAFPLLTYITAAPEQDSGLVSAKILVLVMVAVWFLVYIFSGLKGDLRWKDETVKSTQWKE